MNTHTNSVGQQIKRIRKARLMSQGALSELIDIDPKSIGRIEKGDYHPSVDTLMRLSTALNVSIREFFPANEQNASDGSAVVSDIRHEIVDFAYTVGEESLFALYKQLVKIRDVSPKDEIEAV